MWETATYKGQKSLYYYLPHNSIPLPVPTPTPQHANNINIHISSLFVKPQHSLTTHQRLWDHKSMWLFRRSWQQTHFHSPASWRVSLRTVRRYTPLSCSKTWRGGCWDLLVSAEPLHLRLRSACYCTHTHTQHTQSQSKCSLAITVLHTDTKETSASNATGKESNSV